MYIYGGHDMSIYEKVTRNKFMLSAMHYFSSTEMFTLFIFYLL